ncbi:hypothetical protein KP509_1Z270100 [Ceratopteris richardii]|nr:hypothetical protein KP509_1Z270100 [Ceratopteris richardii]
MIRDAQLLVQFMHEKGKGGLVTVDDLEMGINKLKLFQQPLTKKKSLGSLRCKLYLDLQTCGNHQLSPDKRTSAFLKLATTTLLHHITLRNLLPIDPSSDSLFNIVKDGVLLCKLINVAVPETIDERALNIKENLNVWEQVENHNLCLNSAKAIGCSVVNIGTQDLMEGRPHLVLGLIFQIIKIQLLANVNLKETPELVEMVNDTELLNLPADKVLLRWMNYHLQKAGCFQSNDSLFLCHWILKLPPFPRLDCEAYTYLLHTLAPQTCDLTPLDIKDPLERAKALLIQADQIGCCKYVSPKDIVDGSTNLNLAFVANLFHERYVAVDVVNLKQLFLLSGFIVLFRNGLKVEYAAVSFEMIKDDEQISREERAFRMWINSLGISTYVNNLFEDLRDGWILLEVLDKIVPGIVDWKLANRPPIKLLLKKVENCNQVITIGRNLKLSVVNIAGNDVSDADILEWANSKVKTSGKKRSHEQTKACQPVSFFLDLLAAVEPRVVNWQLVTKGESENDKKQNAEYIISVARKLGCAIFLLWDDIVEVRHKMILILTASIMIWSLANQYNKAAAAVTGAVLTSPLHNGNKENGL